MEKSNHTRWRWNQKSRDWVARRVLVIRSVAFLCTRESPLLFSSDGYRRRRSKQSVGVVVRRSTSPTKEATRAYKVSSRGLRPFAVLWSFKKRGRIDLFLQKSVEIFFVVLLFRFLVRRTLVQKVASSPRSLFSQTSKKLSPFCLVLGHWWCSRFIIFFCS